MPRANRYILPGQIDRLTHRCLDREFLLRFAVDRNAYRQKLREAIHELNVSLVDYCITSNHVHFLPLAKDHEERVKRQRMVISENARTWSLRKIASMQWGNGSPLELEFRPENRLQDRI